MVLLFCPPLSPLTAQDTIPPASTDSLVLSLDSLPKQQGEQNFRYSKDSLDAEVTFDMQDSMKYDIRNRRIYLYGNAKVTYTTINLQADYIIFDWETKIVTAKGIPDSTGRILNKPLFKDGDQEFTADSLRYNFESRKGIVYQVTTQQSGVYVRGAKSKFVSTENMVNDTLRRQDVIYSQNAIFTTCEHEVPHYGIRSNKQKIIPNKLIIIGPSRLEIGGVPTPLFLPFGFFPVKEQRSTGLLFPRDYEYSEQWGFGLRDIGWYFPLGDHHNLSVKGDIYFKGTWGLSVDWAMRKRYKYNGNLNLSYASRRMEDNNGKVSFDPSMALRGNYSMDTKAHPTIRFSGSANIQLNDFQRTVQNDAASVLNTTLSSNFNFSKIFPNKPYSFSASFNHSQSTVGARNVNISFPNLNFQTQTLYPFKRKKPVGPSKWYEQVAVQYRAEAQNRLSAPDSALFSQQTLQNMQSGMRQNATLSTSFKLLKYLNLNPSANYQEIWYFNRLEKTFDPTTPTFSVDTTFSPDGSDFQIDTTFRTFGSIEEMRRFAFGGFRTFNASMSLGTNLFGTLNFGRKSWLRGVRHVMKPSASLNFSPSYNYNQFVDTLRYTANVNQVRRDSFQRYTVFDNGIYGQPPFGQNGEIATEPQMSIGYSINNIFEAKVRAKKDSTDKNSLDYKKIKLFDNIVINGSYNPALDSLNFSQLRWSGTTRFLKGLSTFNVNGIYDFYDVDAKGKRINQFYRRNTGKFLRFVDMQANLSTSFSFSEFRKFLQGGDPTQDRNGRSTSSVPPNPNDPNAPPQDDNRQQKVTTVAEQGFLDLFDNFRINHNVSATWTKVTGTQRDTLVIGANSLNLTGSLQLTQNIALNLGNFGYDFSRKGFSYPYLSFSFGLHCWEMNLSWAPTRGTYTFFIGVRPGSPLEFLKIPYNRNNADRFGGF